MKHINKLGFFLLLLLPLKLASAADSQDKTAPFNLTISQDTHLTVHYEIPPNSSAVTCKLNGGKYSGSNAKMSLSMYTKNGKTEYVSTSEDLYTLLLADTGFYSFHKERDTSLLIVDHKGQFRLFVHPETDLLGRSTSANIDCDYKDYSTY